MSSVRGLFRFSSSCGALGATGVLIGLVGCSDGDLDEPLATVELALTLSGNVSADFVDTRIDSKKLESPIERRVPIPSGSSTVAAVYGGLLGGKYSVELTAESRDGSVQCSGKGQFEISAGQTAYALIVLDCKKGSGSGGVRVGEVNFCPTLGFLFAAPLTVDAGQTIDVEAQGSDIDDDTVSYVWTSTSGSFDKPMKAKTKYHCDEPGMQTLTVTLDDGNDCSEATSIEIECIPSSPPPESEVCGDGVVGVGESCEPPGTSGCDSTCQLVAAE